ncbi:MAG: hypothetical protein IPL77_05855 [Flavobacteriales bacterium]|jgi:hypothetical protein|nr:hypothetical protein [Flavobacteriales bacterium]MBK9538034.1 hypothetical protein [Flavobacteriales bacterium]
MNSYSFLFVIAGLLGIFCFGIAYLVQAWPRRWRYGILFLGHVLLVVSGYFMGWLERDPTNMVWLLLADSFVIPWIWRKPQRETLANDHKPQPRDP